MSLSFEEEAHLIKLREEAELRVLAEKRKLESLKHDYQMQQIRLKTANEDRLMHTRAHLIEEGKRQR